MSKVLLLWQVGLIANVKLHFFSLFHFSLLSPHNHFTWNFWFHMFQAHGRKKVMCEICSQLFQAPFLLRVHMASHSGE